MREIPGNQFSMESRSWNNDLRMYQSTLKYIAESCKQTGVHIEEVPEFVLNLMEHKTPTSNQGQMWNFDSD